MRRTRIKRTRLKKKSRRYDQIKECDALLRRVVLARDGHACRKCGAGKKDGRGGGLHASHILPKGAWPGLRFELDNVLTLCTKHHLYWWHKDPVEAMEWINEHLGPEWIKRLRTLGRMRKTNRDLAAVKLMLTMELPK